VSRLSRCRLLSRSDDVPVPVAVQSLDLHTIYAARLICPSCVGGALLRDLYTQAGVAVHRRENLRMSGRAEHVFELIEESGYCSAA
jgi:hypothetical protein